MEPSGVETSARPRALLGGITLLIALTLSVRVLDAAYVVPAFRPMVAQAAVRLLASAVELEAHKPAESQCAGRYLSRVLSIEPLAIGEAEQAGPIAQLRCELLNLPPPAHGRV